MRCILFACDYRFCLGLTSEGIYRKSGVNSRVAALCERFRQDARSLRLREGEHQVDDVSNTLKRFFRELEEGLFTSEDGGTWLTTAGKVHMGLALHPEILKVCLVRSPSSHFCLHSRFCCDPAIQDESIKIPQYQILLNKLPRVNRATLRALINHLYW